MLLLLGNLTVALSFCAVGFCPTSVLCGLIEPTLLVEERGGCILNFGRTPMGGRGPLVGGAPPPPMLGWNVCNHGAIMSLVQ